MSATIYRFSTDLGFPGFSVADRCRPVSHPPIEGVPELRFARTTLGEAEVQRPSHELARQVRELLLTVGETVDVDQTVSEVREAQLADAMLLFNGGLIRIASFDANPSSRSARIPLRSLIVSLLSLSADDLYTLLTQQAKLRLGLLQGFRMVLALERCSGHHEQCALAVRFVQEIWRAYGEAGLRPLSTLLKS